MHDSRVRAGLQHSIHDDVPVALGVVVLEAQQCHCSTVQQLAYVRKRIARVGGVEDLPVPLEGLGFASAEPGTVVLRVTKAR